MNLKAKLFILICSSLFATACIDCSTPDTKAEIQTITLTSDALTDAKVAISAERDVLVVLPPNYHANLEQSYPVVYLLHGFGAKAHNWFDESGSGPNVSVALEKLYEKGEIDEMIVVVPDSYSEFSLGGWYSNSEAGGLWEDYLVNDVFNYVDTHFRTNTFQRGIAGSSMGGYGALKLALTHPDKFSAVYAMSPAMVGRHWSSYLASDAQLNRISNNLREPKSTWSGWDKITYSVLLTFAANNTPPDFVALPVTQDHIEQVNQHSILSLLTELTPEKRAHIRDNEVAFKLDVGNRDIETRNDLLDLAHELESREFTVHHSVYKGGHYDKLDKLIEQEAFQFFSQRFNDSLPERLPPSLEHHH